MQRKEWNVYNVHKARVLELGYDAAADELRVQEVEVQLCLSAKVQGVEL